MSTIWTPSGERPVRPSSSGGSSAGAPGGPSAPPPPSGRGEGAPDEAELREQMDELRQQLAGTPAELVIANHGFGLFELAALHLSLVPPQLPQARLAIDALGALVDGMDGRLGEQEPTLRDGLAQLRMAYVQIQAAAHSGVDAPSSSGEPTDTG